ncbi:MAG: hypothetical protein A2319_01925 [Candidatus Kerfeldbacteria bacterium RIFOXYB2_FULL_38_14]|uniref:DUF86 domain-containing protein n=1 Tax=Candidatus Kerfeldbacteria bacterium RIFOXYB2_FULL_38_14 TaxID=1798547 RepID=A0A1G2BBJ4_9BACT|nr:MAG: hypothetical protein A2319_01925 [Candidatus Kerfeldbacteria bacterium RIFOXYB2_FULL_38_14]
MNERDDLVYIKHINDNLTAIFTFLQTTDTKEKFTKNFLIQNAIMYQLMIMGEAVKNLSSEFRKNHIYIPWSDITGLRDKLIHHYFGTDINILWDTLQKDLPELRKNIAEIVKNNQ